LGVASFLGVGLLLGSRLSAFGFRLSAFSSWLLALGSWRSALGSRRSALGSWHLVLGFQFIFGLSAFALGFWFSFRLLAFALGVRFISRLSAFAWFTFFEACVKLTHVVFPSDLVLKLTLSILALYTHFLWGLVW
jgi:hypothetical protein